MINNQNLFWFNLLSYLILHEGWTFDSIHMKINQYIKYSIAEYVFNLIAFYMLDSFIVWNCPKKINYQKVVNAPLLSTINKY